MACEKENESLIKYLIEHGADVNSEYELCEFYEAWYGDDSFDHLSVDEIKARPVNHEVKTPLKVYYVEKKMYHWWTI